MSDANIAIVTRFITEFLGNADLDAADAIPAARGQAAIRRLAKAQAALIDASGDVLRVHGDLRSIGRELAGYDLHECPKLAGEVTHLQAVA